MKKYLYFFIICIGMLLTKTIATMFMNNEKKLTLTEYWVNTHKQPTQTLLELLSVLKIPHDGTLESIVKATQSGPNQWLRPSGLERWQIQEKKWGNPQEIMRLLKALQLVDELPAQTKNYTYALLLGATVDRMRHRLAYLVKEWERGIRWNELVFLVGARPLDPTIEGKDIILGVHENPLTVDPTWHFNGTLPTTEAEALTFIWQQTLLPEALRAQKILFVETPLQSAADGTVRRPNTEDTIRSWLALSPKPGSCLAASNQPYCTYQESVLKTVLPNNFTIEMIGESDEAEPIELYLDSAARLLYQERKRLSS